jgi:hypothetical protein
MPLKSEKKNAEMQFFCECVENVSVLRHFNFDIIK